MMKIGTPPFAVTVTDAHGVVISFESTDLDLEPEIEEPPLPPSPYEVVIRSTPRVKYYRVGGTTETIAMDASHAKIPIRRSD